MLQKNSVVKATTKAIESLYRGKASVYTYEEYQRENGLDAQYLTCKYEDIPCMISTNSIPVSTSSGLIYSASKEVKLFISNKVMIPPGSKITVEQDGTTSHFASSGSPAMYPTHQEINVELWGGDTEC